ncbi:hypothetical protein DNTS_016699 [Danionella cerebrum]|uniref:Golgi resident protein GCP60 n=1 Tax=Danionella cerebrum TaxID=2873325 RepID=A0A553QEE6_9TELE|nr:hypothetical protein DNTS_016699 [Danionella translucida]
MMEFDREEHGCDRFQKPSENGVTAEADSEGDPLLKEEDEPPPKSWSLERNWGFTLEELFKLALKFFKEMNGKAFNPTYEENLRLVALHKQITFGPYNHDTCPEIGFFDVLGSDRRKEWLRLGSMAKEDAMEDFVKLLNSCCTLFAPYVTSHKIEKDDQKRRQKEEEERLQLEREEQERRWLEEEAQRREEEERRIKEKELKIKEEMLRIQIDKQKEQIMAVLNAQTAVQFQLYAKQQFPEHPEQQQALIRQLQEQHYQQYVQQALRLQQMALQKKDEDSNLTQASENPDVSSETVSSSQSHSSEDQDNQTDSKAFNLFVEGKTEDERRILAPSMWTRPQIKEFKEKVLHDEDAVITVGRGEVLTVRVPTHADGSYLFWEFATDHYDIGFGLFFEWKDVTVPAIVPNEGESTTESKQGKIIHIICPKKPNTGYFLLFPNVEGEKQTEQGRIPLINEVVPVSRRDSHEEVYAGSHQYPGEGVHLLKFDNSYSLWRPKVVYYRVYYTR